MDSQSDRFRSVGSGLPNVRCKTMPSTLNDKVVIEFVQINGRLLSRYSNNWELGTSAIMLSMSCSRPPCPQ